MVAQLLTTLWASMACNSDSFTFLTVCHCSLSSTAWIQSMPSHHTSLRSILIPRFRTGLLHLAFPTKLCWLLNPPYEILMFTCHVFSKVANSRHENPSNMFWTECSKIRKQHYVHDHASQTWKGYLLLSFLFPTSFLPATKDKYHRNTHRLFKKIQNYYHLVFLYTDY
jgi:hypothetical protein